MTQRTTRRGHFREQEFFDVLATTAWEVRQPGMDPPYFALLGSSNASMASSASPAQWLDDRCDRHRCWRPGTLPPAGQRLVQQALRGCTETVAAGITAVADAQPALDRQRRSDCSQRRTAAGPDQQAVVLASGDPLWFGIGRILIERLELRFHPGPSSLQLAFARLGRPWKLNGSACMDATQRPWRAACSNAPAPWRCSPIPAAAVWPALTSTKRRPRGQLRPMALRSPRPWGRTGAATGSLR